jgi:hypothetical protein
MRGSDHPERTKAEFCRYNQIFGQWVYTEAWVSFLVRKLRDSQAYREVLNREPASWALHSPCKMDAEQDGTIRCPGQERYSASASR